MDRLLSMRVFQRVLDEGGFAACARSLDLSPAVVTRLVADLEEHLGTRLLQRTTRRVSLTEAGQAYLARVRHILQDIDEADAAISAHTQEMAGTLRILATPVLAVHILAPVVAGFHSLYPAVRLDINVDSAREPLIEDYDLTLLSADASFDAHVIARPIASSDAILVASPAYLQRSGPLDAPQQLAQHDCLRLNQTGSRARQWHLMDATAPGNTLDIEVEATLWSNHIDTLLRATLDGAGISAQPTELIAPYLEQGQLVRVLSPWITGHFTLYAALPSRKFMLRRTQVFLDYLSEQTRALVARAGQG
jgi:DNA-binding transcriptional LysR family regulator